MHTENIYFDNLEREFTYLIGKNAQDNFNIIDCSNPYDIWFHISGHSSCHVVLKLQNDEKLCKKSMNTLIKKGALLCKLNTHKLKNEKNIEVIYTPIKNVEKTKVKGSVIAKNTKSLII